MRDGRFRYAELEGEVAHTQFRPRQSIENADARGIPEHSEDLSQAFDSVRIERGHLNTCSYITTMGLPAQTCFGYDRALGRLKTRVLYELRERRG